MSSLKGFFNYLQETQVQFLDFRFTDLKGTWHHITFPVSAVDEDLLKEGIFFDGSSIPGWCPINQSDTLLIPDIDTDLKNVTLDPFSSHSTLIVMCDVHDPITNQVYSKDPRAVGKRAEDYLKKQGLLIKLILDQKPNFLFLMECVMGLMNINLFMKLLPMNFH